MRSRESKKDGTESDKDRGEDGMGWDGAKAKPRARMESGQTRLSGTEQSRYEQSGADTVRKPTTRLCIWFVTHG